MAEPYMRLAFEETPRYENAPVIAPYRVSTINFYWPVRTARIDPGISLFERNDEVRGTLSDPATLIDAYDPTANIGLYGYVNPLVPLLHLSGLVANGVVGLATNAVQTITMTGAPTGGTFTLTFGAQTTAALPYNATAAQVQAALQALTTIGIGNVYVTGGPLPATGVVVTFTGSLGGAPQATMTHADSLTGGTTPAVVVTATTVGAANASALDPDGNRVPTGVTLWTFTKRSGPVAKSAQLDIVRPGEAFYERLTGAGVSQLSLNANGELTTDLMGLVHSSITDPGLTPSYDSQAILPVRRGDFLLTWLSGSALVQDFSMQVANAIERGDHLGVRSYFRKRLDHTGASVRLTGNVTMRDITATEFAATMSQQTFAGKAAWKTPKTIGATAYPYSAWVTMPSVQLRSITTDPLTDTRRFGSSYDFWAAYDEAAGYDFQVVVANGMPLTAAGTSNPTPGIENYT